MIESLEWMRFSREGLKEGGKIQNRHLGEGRRENSGRKVSRGVSGGKGGRDDLSLNPAW